MKLIALIAALALACGASADTDDMSDLYQSESDLPEGVGKSEQPIIYWDAYGVDDAQKRCWFDNGNAGWSGKTCRMPNGVRWTIIIPDANNTAGCDADSRVGISNAATAFRDMLNARGWSISLLTFTELGGQTPGAKTASVSCRTDPPTPNTLGATTVPSLLAAQLGDVLGGATVIDAGARGKIISFNTVQGPHLYQNNWKAQSFWAGKTTTQKRTFVRNVALHELFHVAGLGHDTIAETPLMGLQSNITSAFNTLNPTTFELNMLDCVNPNRNGLFELCTL